MIIELTQGFVTEIDDIDSDLAGYNWCYANGYAARNEKCATINLHSMVLERKLGRCIETGKETDHKDRNKLNNRRDNLREVTRRISMLNRSLFKNNTSGYKGVYKGINGWFAQIRVNGILVYLGSSKTPEEANDLIEFYKSTHSLIYDY